MAHAGLYALGVLANDNVFAGRTRFYSLDSRLGGLQISNGFGPFEPSACLLHNVEGGFHGRRLFCDKSSKLTAAILCGFGAIRTDVGSEFLVALLFVLNLHLVN
jgi:hypothetical protein